jgi:hypothetical protein
MNKLLTNLIMLLCLMFLFACKKDENPTNNGTATPQPGQASITFVMGGTTKQLAGECKMNSDSSVTLAASVYGNDNFTIKIGNPISVRSIQLGNQSTYIEYSRQNQGWVDWVASFKYGSSGTLQVAAFDLSAKTISGTFGAYLNGVPSAWDVRQGTFIGRWQ